MHLSIALVSEKVAKLNNKHGSRQGCSRSVIRGYQVSHRKLARTITLTHDRTYGKGSDLIDLSSGKVKEVEVNLQTAPILPLGHIFIPGQGHNLMDKYQVIHIKYCDGTRKYALDRITESEDSNATMAWMVVTETNLVAAPRFGAGAPLRLDNGPEDAVEFEVAQRWYNPGLQQWTYSMMEEGQIVTCEGKEFVSEEWLAEKLVQQQDAIPTDNVDEVQQQDAMPTDNIVEVQQQDAIPTDNIDEAEETSCDETCSDTTQEDSQDEDYNEDSEDASEGEEEPNDEAAAIRDDLDITMTVS